MSKANHKRATIYFDPHLHEALRTMASETDRSISELVNQAVSDALADDADDLLCLDQREDESSQCFDEVLANMKLRGKL